MSVPGAASMPGPASARKCSTLCSTIPDQYEATLEKRVQCNLAPEQESDCCILDENEISN